MQRAWLLALVGLALVGCRLRPLDVEGRPCPCPDGYTCDSATQTCVQGSDLGVGLMNGASCEGASDCSSGHCVDGVCCESACDGTCEACNLPGQLGTCAAIAMGQDPAMECAPRPLLQDLGTADGGEAINLPDGGVNAMQGPCAPSCNGQRACGYPDETVACGDTFCNTNDERGELVCDGAGHCGVNLVSCAGYACEAKTCETSCATDADCDDTHYCNGLQCVPKKGIGVACDDDPNECLSGYCANNVCCSSDCGNISGGVCNQAGSVGQCLCVTNYAPQGSTPCNGTCEYYYPDADGDHYGDGAGTAIVGCTGDPNDPPPPGYVAISSTQTDGNGVVHQAGSTDCGDDDANVNPGIIAFNASSTWTSIHGPAFDWNCDGKVAYQYPIAPGATCLFCVPSTYGALSMGTCGGTSPTCATAGEFASLDCGITEKVGSLNYCCGIGCSNPGLLRANTQAFTSGGRACGATGTATICVAACANAGDPFGGADGGAGFITLSETQGCL